MSEAEAHEAALSGLRTIDMITDRLLARGNELEKEVVAWRERALAAEQKLADL